MKKFKNKKIITLVLAIMLAAGAVFWRDGFKAFAQTVLDSFVNEDKVDDKWNVTVNTGAGEVKLSERSCDNGTWFCDEEDVCANTLGDGDFIIVKRANEATTKQWKTANTDCDRPECGADGGQNGDNLVADNTVNFSSYPARDACKTVGGRLPTVTESQCIYTNRVTFGDNFGTSYYWSSTENSESDAWLVGFSTGYTASDNKAYSYSVRCVRGW